MCNLINFILQNIDLVSRILQTLGVTIILVSQIVFYLQVRREWGSLGKAFLDLTGTRYAIENKRLAEMSQTEVKEAFKRYPFAKFLYDDFRISVVGLFLTLIGTLLLFV